MNEAFGPDIGSNFESETLTTFFPKRESRPSEGALFQQADLRNSIYNELNGDLTGRCENALDLAAFVVLHAVTVLLDRSSHPDLEVFRIFEEAISLLVRDILFFFFIPSPTSLTAHYI